MLVVDDVVISLGDGIRGTPTLVLLLALAIIARASKFLVFCLFRFGAPISIVSDVLLMRKPFAEIYRVVTVLSAFRFLAFDSKFPELSGIMGLGVVLVVLAVVWSLELSSLVTFVVFVLLALL